MNEFLQISIYFFCIAITFVALWFVDFTKFIRVDQRSYAIIVYVILSIVFGFLLGKFFIEIGTLIKFASSY